MNMCPSNKCKTSPESCLKGQVFFIWTSCHSAETVKDKISLLGGKVEQCLGTNITTVLVEDNQLVRPDLLSPDLSVKSTYVANGTIVTSFPHPNNLTSLPSTSRGYNLLAASTSNKSAFSPFYRIICFARQYNIQVLGIYQFLTWIEPHCKTAEARFRQKQRKATEHVSHLTGYFLKFEAVQKNYRPCYKMFNNDPERLFPLKNASILLKPETCNFILDKPISSRQIHFSHMDTVVKTAHVKGANLPLKANDKRPQNNRPKPKDESNYCECCKTHFADLKQHIKSSKHQNFVSNDKNYETVHSILKMLPTPQDFIEKLQNPSPNSDPLFVNGDAAFCLPVTNVPETDYSMPLNLQVRKDNISSAVIPLNLHVENNNILSRNIQLIKQETLPLDLHVKKDNNKKTETKEAEVDKNMLVNYEQVDLLSKKESTVIQPIQPKLEVKNEPVLENVEVSEKQPIETNLETPCEVMNGDPLFDRTNTAALAQLCLKNFDSYWLDTLPCEMDDIVFDDIFDFDDGKTKPENETGEPFAENFVNSDIAQTPGFVSGISTPNLRTQTTENTSIIMNNSMDVKDNIKIEPVNNQSFPRICKLEKDNETLDDKKQIFSIASYCADKISPDATPSCSNTMAAKNAELLFSSESSDDDENGNVLISNALNFITNSDSDCKESSEDNSVPDQPEEKSIRNQAASDVKPKNYDEVFSTINSDILNQDKSHSEYKESSVLVRNSPVNEVRVNHAPGNNLIRVISTADIPKNEFENVGELNKGNKPLTNNSKNLSTNIKENCVVSKPVSRDFKSNYQVSENAPGKNMNCNVTNTEKPNNKNSPTINETVSYKIKTDPESHKENATFNKRQELNSSSNKINQNYPVSANGTVEDVKVLKERILCKTTSAEKPVSFESKQLNDTSVSKSIGEKYVIPKKNISLREMKANQNTLDQNLKSPKSIAGEVKINQTNCDKIVRYPQHKQERLHQKLIENPEVKVQCSNSNLNSISPKLVPCSKKLNTGTSETYSRKRHHKKEKKIHKRIKEDNSFDMKCSVSETNAKKDCERLQAHHSVNPCQYSSRTEKFKVDKSNKPSAVLPVSKQTKNIPHKKASSKLQKLPPLWSVSAVPGSGVKLKFTCIHPKRVDVHQFETSDSSSEHSD